MSNAEAIVAWLEVQMKIAYERFSDVYAVNKAASYLLRVEYHKVTALYVQALEDAGMVDMTGATDGDPATEQIANRIAARVLGIIS